MSEAEPVQLTKLRREAKDSLNAYAEGYGTLKQFLDASTRLDVYLDMHPEANRDAPRG